MAHLLDTDMVIDHLAGRTSATDRVGELAEADVFISMVTYMEVFQGILRDPNRAVAEANLAAFVDMVPIIPFSEEVARRCAMLREDLRLDGRRVRSRFLDLITAATALEHGLSLVTRNTDDYDDIPGLILA